MENLFTAGSLHKDFVEEVAFGPGRIGIYWNWCEEDTISPKMGSQDVHPFSLGPRLWSPHWTACLFSTHFRSPSKTHILPNQSPIKKPLSTPCLEDLAFDLKPLTIWLFCLYTAACLATLEAMANSWAGHAFLSFCSNSSLCLERPSSSKFPSHHLMLLNDFTSVTLLGTSAWNINKGTFLCAPRTHCSHFH